MKNCCSWLPEAVAIAGVAIGVGVAFRGWPALPDVDGLIWAGWVQAIGSVVAILVAVWVAYYQHQKTEARLRASEANEVRSFLLGVREELAISWRVYMQQAGDGLAKTEKGEVVQLTWLPPEQPFKVYGATVGKIGNVPDDDLRASVIQTYVVAGGLLYTWKTHNQLLSEFESRDGIPYGDGQIQAVVDYLTARQVLIDYGDGLRNHQIAASQAITETINAIDAYLGRRNSRS